MRQVLATERLLLRELGAGDAAFILRLLNEPSWLRYIGDKQVRSLDDARGYIEQGPVAMYARHGFGLYCVQRREDAACIGLCGLIRRAQLADVDIGFALLPEYWNRGYALEAASAVMDYGYGSLGLPRIVAITAPDNHSSARLLNKLGLHFSRSLPLAGADVVSLFEPG